MTERITSREYVMFALYATLTSKLMSLPAVIYSVAGQDAIFSFIINIIIELILITLISFLIKNNKNTSFYEFLSKKLSKVGATIVISIISLYLFFKAMFIFIETYAFFIDAVYENYSIWYFFIPAFFVTAYMAIKGERTLGKCMEIFSAFVAVGLVVSFLNSIGTIPFDTNLPYFKNGITESMMGSLHSSPYIGNSFILLFFMGKVQIHERTVPHTIIFSSLVGLFVVILCFSYYNLFGNSVIYTTFAITSLSQFNPYVSDLGHLNWLSVIVSTVNLFCISSLILYALGQSTKNIFKIKKPIYSISIICGLMLVILRIFNFDLQHLETLITSTLFYPASCTIGLLIILLFLLNIGNRRTKNEKCSY